MDLKFTKMQGCGNDYVYVDCVREQIDIADKSGLAIKISDRHFGVGSDGLIFINPSKTADFEMEMYNSDGSRAQMCGNGIRCVAKYVYDNRYTSQEHFTIESAGSIKHITVIPENGLAATITVDMGKPILEAADIPVISRKGRVVSEDLDVSGSIYKVTCVSMGNPHAVVFSGTEGSTDFKLDSLDIEKTGPLFENHSRFPKRINTEFVRVRDRSHMDMRVWERGAGETLACGTGCCACAVAGVLNGLTDNKVFINVLGGVLEIFWDPDDGHVYMTGPARTVFAGTYTI